MTASSSAALAVQHRPCLHHPSMCITLRVHVDSILQAASKQHLPKHHPQQLRKQRHIDSRLTPHNRPPWGALAGCTTQLPRLPPSTAPLVQAAAARQGSTTSSPQQETACTLAGRRASTTTGECCAVATARATVFRCFNTAPAGIQHPGASQKRCAAAVVFSMAAAAVRQAALRLPPQSVWLFCALLVQVPASQG